MKLFYTHVIVWDNTKSWHGVKLWSGNDIATWPGLDSWQKTLPGYQNVSIEYVY